MLFNKSKNMLFFLFILDTFINVLQWYVPTNLLNWIFRLQLVQYLSVLFIFPATCLYLLLASSFMPNVAGKNPFKVTQTGIIFLRCITPRPHSYVFLNSFIYYPRAFTPRQARVFKLTNMLLLEVIAHAK